MKDIIIKESYAYKDFSDMVKHYRKEEESSSENFQSNSSVTIMQGCPICKRVYSPFTRMCLYCSSKEIPTITLSNTSTNLK